MRDHPEASPPSALPPVDEEDDSLSRRVFVHQLAFVGGGVVLLGSACKDAPKVVDAGAAKKASPLTSSHKTLTDEEYLVVSAAAERVLPKDEDPGAIELGVPEYIDKILQTEQLAKMKADFLPGIAALNRRSQRMYKLPFNEVTAAQQDELLTLFKNSPEKSGEARWYEILVVLTMEGALGDPSYGGNKGEAGWKLMGFKLVGRIDPKGKPMVGDPTKGYDGTKHLHDLRCGGGKGC